jgi:hypothetical protein
MARPWTLIRTRTRTQNGSSFAVGYRVGERPGRLGRQRVGVGVGVGVVGGKRVERKRKGVMVMRRVRVVGWHSRSRSHKLCDKSPTTTANSKGKKRSKEGKRKDRIPRLWHRVPFVSPTLSNRLTRLVCCRPYRQWYGRTAGAVCWVVGVGVGVVG